MKKTIVICLLFLLPTVGLFAQVKTDKLDKKSTSKRTPQYKPIFFGFEAARQTTQTKIDGSANITSISKMYPNFGIYGGYQLAKQRFSFGVSVGQDDNSWNYKNARINVDINSGSNRATINGRIGYDYQFLTISDRLNLTIGGGLNLIHLLKNEANTTAKPQVLDKLITGEIDSIYRFNSLGIDGKLQLNFALSPHIQVHLFGQYRYAPTSMYAASIGYYDAITGIKQDLATIKSHQTAPIFGIGLQYNLQPFFKREKIIDKSK
jgi:hypothetical protein